MGVFKDWGDKLTGQGERRRGRAAQAASDALAKEQLNLSKEALAFAREQDATKQQLGSDWYNNQTGIATAEDARRFGLLPQIQENAQATMDEVMANAGLYYDEQTGNAYDAEGQLMGNAEELYANMTGDASRYSQDMLDSAQYSDDEYQQAAGQGSADVAQSFAKAREATRRNMLRAGINPNSSQYADQEIQSGNDEALAEAGTINSERRRMRAEARGATRDALTAGYGARTSAETTGRDARRSAITTGAGLVGSALQSGRSALDDAIRYGRGAMDDAYKTNLNTRSSQLGIGDPRLGMTSAALSQMNNNIGTYGAQAGQKSQQAQAHNAAGAAVLSDTLGAVATVAGSGSAKPPAPKEASATG